MKTPQEIKIMFFKTERNDIFFLKSILESYEGMCIIRTYKRISEDHAIIEILINSYFSEVIEPIIEDFQKEVHMEELSPQNAESIPEWVHPANKFSKWEHIES